MINNTHIQDVENLVNEEEHCPILYQLTVRQNLKIQIRLLEKLNQ